MKKFVLLASCVLAFGCANHTQEPEWTRDEIIQATLLEFWGEDLDRTYNQADLEECPWEEGNWVLDIASEMDWEDLIPLIINMPDFGSDEDYEMLDIITDGEWICYCEYKQ